MILASTTLHSSHDDSTPSIRFTYVGNLGNVLIKIIINNSASQVIFECLNKLII